MCLSAASNLENRISVRWKFNLLFCWACMVSFTEQNGKIPGLSMAVEISLTLSPLLWCLWWNCVQSELVAAGLWLLLPCHSSGRCFMACSGTVPLASTVASSPEPAELHRKTIVRRDWRREHYYVVLHPLTFYKILRWHSDHSANLARSTFFFPT